MLLAHAALKAVFFSAPFLAHLAIPIENGTSGFISTLSVAGLIEWAVLVGVLMLGVGRLRPSDLGLSWRPLREALPVLVGVWVVSQAASVSIGSAVGPLAAVGGGPSDWWWAGRRLQAIVGSGLIEEVLYRGFLLTQLFLWLRERTSRSRALAWAIVLTSAYFGLNHVPAGLSQGMGAAGALGYAAETALGGALFAALFLRTGNLFIAAGAHALINDPIALVETPFDPSFPVLVAVAGLILAWPVLARRLGGVFTVGTVEGVPAV